ncbi:archaemetzincin-2 [Colletotrichum spaethianum]|uniref:Archaemetzincin-2 n=1 Tax=Colletotrichum spaethianum TaxID=700344 RepID=A0AA37L9D4_9PEZI|nr:archaemetzincin-2 [Colletotrichum spaethianum]GKT44248.1 archaemetzincin-2 [Colletotrichum spaethianum]
MAPRRRPKGCPHDSIIVEASEYGRKKAGFVRVPFEKRVAAATRSGRATANSASDVSAPDPATFPGPLVLPDDDLALEPGYETQSLRSWASGHWRNPITPERKTLYVADVPAIDESAAFMRDWSSPDLSGAKPPVASDKLEHPKAADVMGYFSAFYHPLPVKPLPAPLRFVKWKDDERPAGGEPKKMTIGLETGGGSVVGIRARPSPDDLARMQLNLCDLLDALMAILPEDAYAACMVVAQDLYEDEDDDFCCGRAFGGSRICVVSSFRYRPAMDRIQGVERGHMWPASHCERFVVEAVEWWEEQDALENGQTGEGSGGKKKVAKRKGNGGDDDDGETTVDFKEVRGTAMGAAIEASRDVLVPRTTPRRAEEEDLRGMWFARVARTAAHEVGHCLGLDHCVYYACVMQGTSGLGEDGRQPPYFCPVCEAKFVWGLGERGIVEGGMFGKWREGRQKEVERERMEAMSGFCELWKGVGMFAGYRGWLEARLSREFAVQEVEVIDLTG